jgi:predicted NBD/HSP70 family sugar kinase
VDLGGTKIAAAIAASGVQILADSRIATNSYDMARHRRSHIVTALHPDLVVLGGSVAALDDLLIEPVRQTVRDRVRMFPVHDLCIERSLLEDKAGLLGGIALAAQNFHEKVTS